MDQVYEQVGELSIHCQFGCKKVSGSDDYELDPNGMYVL